MKTLMVRQSVAVALAACAVTACSVASANDGSGTNSLRVSIGEPVARVAVIDPSLARETEAAIYKALDWMVANQHPDGSWSDTNYPALTALPLWAFARSNHPRKKEVCDKAVQFILSCVQSDGGIYRKIAGRPGGGLGNYNTATCMTALYATGRDDLLPTVQRARKYIASSQYMGDDAYRGGLGYDAANQRSYTDLMNSLFGFEAMRLTEGAEDLKPKTEARTDLDWNAARKFLERLQNDANSDKANAGGFPYRPDESKAGVVTNDAGKIIFQSYGSMTYAGLLSLVYCKVDRNDPRVRSAFDWSVKHWSLEENPGMGPQGLYFFYYVLTKALAAYGQDPLPAVAGRNAVEWRSEVVKKILGLQKTDDGKGFWLNESGRFMESDKVLCTAYCLLTLEIASGM
ncbi:MAG: prenyltransferase/squalene oxidase repeat-containing protein [bacterium]